MSCSSLKAGDPVPRNCSQKVWYAHYADVTENGSKHDLAIQIGRGRIVGEDVVATNFVHVPDDMKYDDTFIGNGQKPAKVTIEYTC